MSISNSANIEQLITSPGMEQDPRKKSILDEAIRTFAELGFRGADVQVIADRVGIGKGTVYRNYGTKEELFWAAVSEVDARLRLDINEVLQKKLPETVEDFLRTVAVSYAEFFEKHPDCLELNVLARSEFRGSIPQTQQEMYQREIDLILNWFQEGMDRGELKAMDPRSASFAFSAMMDGVTSIYCYSDAMGWKRSMVEQMEIAVDLFFHGIRTSPDTT
ncbi:MAG: TetR/AcrR family transcriptional regulator [Planctomycetia bacterium]|jgi:AcrR family transcriptional regulator